MSGDIPRGRRGKTREGSWKASTFPPPVGISTKASRPDKVCSIISCCPGRKASCPKYCLSHCSMSCKCYSLPSILLTRIITCSTVKKVLKFPLDLLLLIGRVVVGRNVNPTDPLYSRSRLPREERGPHADYD